MLEKYWDYMRDQAWGTYGIVELDTSILSLIWFVLSNLTLYTVCTIALGASKIRAWRHLCPRSNVVVEVLRKTARESRSFIKSRWTICCMYPRRRPIYDWYLQPHLDHRSQNLCQYILSGMNRKKMKLNISSCVIQHSQELEKQW